MTRQTCFTRRLDAGSARRVLAAGIAMTAAALLAACGGSPAALDDAAAATAAGSDGPARVVPVIEPTLTGGLLVRHDEWREAGYRWDWTGFPQAGGSAPIAHFGVMGGSVVTIDEATWVSTLDDETGRSLWASQAASPTTRFVGMAPTEGAFLAFARSEIYAFDPESGSLLAKQPLSKLISTPPLIKDGVAAFGTPTGEVLAHRYGTLAGELRPAPYQEGSVAWRHTVGAAVNQDPVLMAGDTVGAYVGLSGEVLMLDFDSGRLVGRYKMLGNAESSPVTDGARLYAVSADRTIYVYEPRRDAEVARVRVGERMTDQPAIHAGVLYLTVPSRGLTAFDMRRGTDRGDRVGEVLWSASGTEGEVVGVVNGELLVWDEDARVLTVLEANAGDAIITLDLPGAAHVVVPDFEDGPLYVVTDDNAVVKLSPR